MKLIYRRCALLALAWGCATLTFAQSFDETWVEFLQNNRVSNVSALARPDKRSDPEDFLKYLLIYTNNAFCETDVPKAETLVEEIATYTPEFRESVAGYAPRYAGLKTQISAFYTVDSLWKIFLRTDEVALDDLETIERASKLCEKQTAAKLTYMTAYDYLCGGDLPKATEIFETRTLRLAEKTSLKMSDVEGLGPRVADMKAFFAGLPKLAKAWDEFVATNTSPGFAPVLPTYTCNPEFKIKELVLRGLHDPCGAGRASLEELDELMAAAPAISTVEFEDGVDRLRAAVERLDGELTKLNTTWQDFLAEGKVDISLRYGYTYCAVEPLIQAYLLDGYAFVCGMAESRLQTIDSLRRATKTPLSKETKDKIKELAGLGELYVANGASIEEVWTFFVANDDKLLSDYGSTDKYCDNVQLVKDWTMRGLTADCEGAVPYLEQIERVTKRFDFKYYPELECRVQRLRLKVWDCRFAVLDEIAQLETSSDSTYDARVDELMVEYKMPERPADAVCGEGD